MLDLAGLHAEQSPQLLDVPVLDKNHNFHM
jgi:hypothetical protein